MTTLWASEALLWTAVIVLTLVVIALARQIGVLHERIAPVGALKANPGPGAGDDAPVFRLRTLDGELAVIGPSPQDVRSMLLLFVSADCPVCKRIIPLALRVAKDEGLRLLLIADGDESQIRAMRHRLGIQAVPLALSAEVGMRFGVAKVPHAVLIDGAGIVAASGLVNTREHLESLVVAKQLGIASVQEYLNAQGAVDATTRAQGDEAGHAHPDRNQG